MKSSMTLPIHYTRYSTIGEMMLSSKGMEYFVGMFGGAKSEKEKQQEEEANHAMGAGAERINSR